MRRTLMNTITLTAFVLCLFLFGSLRAASSISGGAATDSNPANANPATNTNTDPNPTNNTQNIPPKNPTGSAGDEKQPGLIQKDFGGPTRSEDKTTITPSGSGNTQNALPPAVVGFKGTVVSVDSATNRVRVRGDDGRISDYVVNKKTRFQDGTKKPNLADVQAGDPVILDYNRQNLSIQRFQINRAK
jgi:hypothetical protein